MQSVGTTLPKLETIGPYSIAAPMGRERNFLTCETFRQFCKPRIENTACINHLALM
jgi:hypothetical protein